MDDEEESPEEDIEVSSTATPDSQERSSQVPREPEGEPEAVLGEEGEKDVVAQEGTTSLSMSSASGLLARGTTGTILKSATFWTLTATLPRTSNGQPGGGSGDSAEYWELWALGGLLMFLYTCVVVLVSGICLWYFLRMWKEPSVRDYGRMVGDQPVEDRLWRWREEGHPGGIWDGISGQADEDDEVSGEYSFSDLDIQSSVGVEIGEFVPQAGRGRGVNPRSRIYRPGQGRARERRGDDLDLQRRRREEEEAASWRPRRGAPEERSIARRRTSQQVARPFMDLTVRCQGALILKDTSD